MAQDRGANVTVTNSTTQYGCLGVWEPNARTTIQKIADAPEAWTHANFPFAALLELKIAGVPVLAFRISYVGDQGWELHFKCECDLARPKVKAADFHGKEAHLKFREREHQPATLCTLSMTSNIDSTGVARYPVGICPVMDPATGATLVDELGRRSYSSSIAFGPSIGKNIALAYLPHDYCQVGRELQIQYFADVYPVKVEAVGYRSLYDPENGKPRS